MEFTSKSGASIVITEAPFEASKNLWNAVQKAASEQKISSQFINDPDSFFNIILRIDSHPDFNAAVWPCLIRCTYNNEKITLKTFEKSEMRSEYYQVLAPCVKANIGPFVESLFLELSAAMAQAASSTPKSAPQ